MHTHAPQALNVVAPASLPEIHFERILAPLRQALNVNLGRWRLPRSVRENLQDVLETTFPSPQHAAMAGADEYAVECAICYNYRSEDDAVPECACDGCGKPFHGSCLSEWLRGLPTTQQSFNRLFGESAPPSIVSPATHATRTIGGERLNVPRGAGECPYCSHPITVDTSVQSRG